MEAKAHKGTLTTCVEAYLKKGAGGKTSSWSAPMKTPYPYLS